MRPIWTLLALAFGVCATVASSPAAGPGDIIGSAGPVTITLDGSTTSVERTATASLTVNQPIEAGSGEVKLTATFPDAPTANLTMSIASADTGEENSTDVDTANQPEVGIGIATWDGCADNCSENLVIDFDLNDTLDGPLDVSFTLDGSASIAPDPSGEAPADPGSIAIDVN